MADMGTTIVSVGRLQAMADDMSLVARAARETIIPPTPEQDVGAIATRDAIVARATLERAAGADRRGGHGLEVERRPCRSIGEPDFGDILDIAQANAILGAVDR